MRYTLPVLLVLIVLTACGKKKDSCWKCEFANSGSASGKTDTTVCNMTAAESKTFQQNQVKKLKAQNAIPPSTDTTSACHKVPF